VTISIIHEDDSLIIINKPAGLATQSANIAQPDCVSLIKQHLRKIDPNPGSEPYVGVVHRLDQPVAGLLVFAKTKKAAGILSRQIREDMMSKHYTAVVEGIVDVPNYTKLTDMMYKDGRSSRAVIVDDKTAADGVKEAALLYRTECIMEDKNLTKVSVKLLTGRFHQIRAQMSHIGHPIAGDAKYGAKTHYPHGIALAADRLNFTHPVTGEKVEKVVDFSFTL